MEIFFVCEMVLGVVEVCVLVVVMLCICCVLFGVEDFVNDFCVECGVDGFEFDYVRWCFVVEVCVVGIELIDVFYIFSDVEGVVCEVIFVCCFGYCSKFLVLFEYVKCFNGVFIFGVDEFVYVWVIVLGFDVVCGCGEDWVLVNGLWVEVLMYCNVCWLLEWVCWFGMFWDLF